MIEDLSKKYENGDGIQDINLVVNSGEILTLLGPSGCGKSTLLRSIGGFERVTTGRILIAEKDVTKQPPEKRSTIMVFQGYNLWERMTVFENLEFGLKLRKVSKSERKQRIMEMLTMLGIEAMAAEYPQQLSGGQQQRVAIGRALVLRPEILLLDEPYSALDAKIRVQMREELKKIQRRLQITIIFVTHDQEEAMMLSTRIAVMKKGEIVQVGTPSEIYNDPKDIYVASFIGEMNFVTADTDRVAAFRPEDAHITSAQEAGENTYHGTVQQSTQMGHYSQLMVKLEEQTIVLFAEKDAFENYPEGTDIFFEVKKMQNFIKGVEK
ncbi:ABC transporter ATP-binding protein [Liquorilactobacillus oeni DSM 19972]|uniref:ABC transporter ATP-binding protein n=2 Tax=Liquorilactobacillus oeni TaxID=303241 RepID=A0A0R1M8U8_9LACO|nr:ABC transporter ATP-binding protein [Liquorilactobacillus oeni DSM 19972]